MNSHNTHNANSTLNSSNSSSALRFKIYSALPYLLVIALSSILCFGLEYKAKEKYEERDVAIAKTIASDFLQMDRQMTIILRDSLDLTRYYLQQNRKPTSYQLVELSKKLGISGISIYNGTTGIQESTSENLNLLNNKEFFKTYSELNIPWSVKLKEKDGSVRINRLSNAKNIERPRRTGTMWDAKLNAFIRVRYDGDFLHNMLAKAAKSNEDIEYITIFAPSGKAILSTNVRNANETVPSINSDKGCDYSNEPHVVFNSYGVFVDFSFGESEVSDSAYTNGLVASPNDPYFLNIVIKFNSYELIKQLWLLRIIFTFIGLFVCIAIYYINKSITQSSHLADMSERMGDKVTHLCNTRLGEVRRYVTKIVRDSMRVDNMNKELPEEMVDLLNRAFREVGEKGLIEAKKEDE